MRRGGFTSRAAAEQARKEVLALSPWARVGQTWTVARWLRYWLTTQGSIRPTTLRIYTQHVESYLVPTIGGVRLAELSVRQLAGMFAELAAGSPPVRRPLSAATVQRVRATLRTALNAAIREGLITGNPARWVELPAGRRPHPVVWTEQRVALWQEHGIRPAVAVWTVEQVAEFLRFVDGDPLYALWWLVALRGLRRGELAGLRWCDVDLDRRQLTVVNQRATAGHRVVEGPPKSAAGCRTIALDQRTLAVLRAHRRGQQCGSAARGYQWREDGYVFTKLDHNSAS